MLLKEFVREKRGAAKLTQPELAEKAGVGLRFVRELEKGKDTQSKIGAAPGTVEVRIPC